MGNSVNKGLEVCKCPIECGSPFVVWQCWARDGPGPTEFGRESWLVGGGAGLA